MMGCVSSTASAPLAEPPAPEPVFLNFAGISLKVPDEEDDPRWCGKAMPPLHKAAKAGDCVQLQRLLDLPGCSIDSTDAGETALHLAAEEGATEALLMLLDRGADISVTNADGWTPIHCAAQSENADAVALLLARGADLHATTEIRATPLHMAAFNGRLDATKLLVLRGADVDARDESGFTPLDDARHKVKACPCTTDEAKRRWGAVIAFLEKVALMGPEERRAFAHRSWGLFVTEALQDAALQGHVAVLRLLLECYGQEIDAKDHDGSTALHSAAEGGSADAVRLLLDRRADVNARSNCDDTALHFAAREGHLAATELLLAGGADASARTRFGATAMDHARRNENREWEAVVALLASREQRGA